MEIFSSWWGTKIPKKDVGLDKDSVTSENDGSADDATVSSSTAEQQASNDQKQNEEPKQENDSVEVDDTQQQPTEDPSDALKSAQNWGSYLFNVAKEGTKVMTSTATKTASLLQKTVEDKTFMGDFNKEQEKFMKEKHSKRSEAAVAPWVGYNEEEQMKEHILALSKDKRNFMRNPPSGVQFHFDFDSSFPVAMAMLQEDPNLSKMRFELVPKSVTEENFWRNYFYRVSLIKQSSQLTSLASATGNNGQNVKQDGTSSKKDENSSESKTEPSPPIAIESKANETSDDAFTDLPPDSPPANEFVSDAFSSEVDQADLQKGMEQLGMTEKEEPSPAGAAEDVPEWEKELQQELQDFEVVDEAEGEVNDEWEDEINQMLQAEVEADQHS
ncbi:synapse-associated protein 1-like [Anneissia japonica]|uniref:synapse-associated protein 1-like n=1 Tax=Anneissia japonica TaxID=1529436 RepID=UPI0014256712|nr:synapse-associated protein 1-like [Anneissia japonica]